MHFTKSFLLSLMSTTWPAYNAKPTAGITSDKPKIPTDKVFFVKMETCQTIATATILKAMIKKARAQMNHLNSFPKEACNCKV